MIKFFIDDIPVESTSGETILKAAEKVGIHIPHFCYHPAFPPEGTCRMCLVEIEGAPKLELACSTQVRDGMKVYTKSEKVVEARKAVLEFLLTEHPLDCPICDQAGDCKLQDYYEEYGLFEGHYLEEKERHAKKVSLGKNLLHDQERCILCRRCVRFLREVTKTGEMGVFERSNKTEVNILEGQTIDNNYSGNLAQLCPVGAITDTDFRFRSRTWFLKKGVSICPLCSRGCSISVQYLPENPRFRIPRKVLRIQAEENHKINGYWICDHGRYGYDYLNSNRADEIISQDLDHSYGWEKAEDVISEKIKRLLYREKTSRIALILSSWLTNEELFLIKKLFKEDLKVNEIYFVDPNDAESDEILLTPERSPNRRGAKEIGFDLNPLKLDDLSAKKIDLLLIFDSFLADKIGSSDLNDFLRRIENKFLVSPRKSELDSMVDISLPSVYPAEKKGSWVNIDGIIQHFDTVFEGPGESRSQFDILLSIAKKIGLNFSYYNQFKNIDRIYQTMKKEITFFQEEQ